VSKRDSNHIRAQRKTKEIDEYMCFFCTQVDKKSHGHHLIYFSEGGPGSVINTITACPTCHRLYHNGKLKIDLLRF
jgi:5-methylcytosine-specific restriction endonuclease McrA